MSLSNFKEEMNDKGQKNGCGKERMKQKEK
jgi:hypothetical protein